MAADQVQVGYVECRLNVHGVCRGGRTFGCQVQVLHAGEQFNLFQAELRFLIAGVLGDCLAVCGAGTFQVAAVEGGDGFGMQGRQGLFVVGNDRVEAAGQLVLCRELQNLGEHIAEVFCADRAGVNRCRAARQNGNARGHATHAERLGSFGELGDVHGSANHATRSGVDELLHAFKHLQGGGRVRCVERKNHGTLARELHELLELFGGVDLVAPGGSGGGLLAALCASRLCRCVLCRVGVQFHSVAYGGGNLLRRTVLCCTTLGNVTLRRVLGCAAVCRIKNNAHPGLLYVLYLLLRAG